MDKQRNEEKYQEIKNNAELGGYQLNPDKDFCLRLVEGLLVNLDRYGIEACPCRLYLGKREDNLDIVCPCNYRDDDLSEYGACFCALYINDKYNADRQIPERRLQKGARGNHAKSNAFANLAFPVWRCNACGYLCANNNPPGICPICKVNKERFERFI